MQYQGPHPGAMRQQCYPPPPPNGRPYGGHPQMVPPPQNQYYPPPTDNRAPITQQQCSTNVIVNAQPTKEWITERDWKAGLFGCCGNMTNCMVVCFCPVCYLAYLSHQMSEGCYLPFCVPVPLMALRLKLRTRLDIKGSICCDFCVTSWCSVCSLCQLTRERDMYLRPHKHAPTI